MIALAVQFCGCGGLIDASLDEATASAVFEVCTGHGCGRLGDLHCVASWCPAAECKHPAVVCRSPMLQSIVGDGTMAFEQFPTAIAKVALLKYPFSSREVCTAVFSALSCR